MINTMTRQEVYNKVLYSTRRQGIVPVEGNTYYRYRGLGDVKYAAGWLIEDAYYDSSFEGKPVYEPAIQGALIASGAFANDLRSDTIDTLDMIYYMQTCDSDYIPISENGCTGNWWLDASDWEAAMIKASLCYGLKYTSRNDLERG